MISERYIESDNCRRELTFALSKKKSFLAVFLEPTELSLGLEMQLSAQLCVLKYNYANDESFFKKLCSSGDMMICRTDGAEQMQLSDGERLSDKDRFVASASRAAESNADSQTGTKSKRLIGILAAAVSLVCIAAAIIVPVVKNYQEQLFALQTEANKLQELEDSFVMGDETNLEYILTAEGNTTGVTICGVWGDQMNQLGNFVVPETLVGYPVTKIDQYAFQSRLGLKRISIPDTVTIMGPFAFNGCADLEQVTLSSNLSYIPDYAFQGCDHLKEITLPSGIVSIGANAFERSGVQKIVLPNSVNSIGLFAFSGCTDLEQIMIPDSVYFIGVRAFENCKTLKDIVLPSSLSEIGFGVFSGCSNLKSIRIPRSVVKIDNEAFKECDALENIYYGGTEEEWKKLLSKIDLYYGDSAGQNNIALWNATVHFNS